MVCLIKAATMLPPIGIYIGSAGRESPFGYNGYWALALVVLSLVVLLAIAVFLLRRGDWIAERLVPIDSTVLTTVTDVGQWGRDAFVLSVKVIGVVCLIKGLPELASGLAEVARRGRYVDWYSSFRFVSGVVLLILGAYFISGGKHLVEFAFRHPEDMPTLDDTNRDAL